MSGLRQVVVRVLPFITASIVTMVTWYQFLIVEYLPTWRHYLGLALVVSNAFLYFIRYRQAVVLTGILLTAASFNLISFYAVTQTSFVRAMNVSTPEMQLWSLLILIIYCIVNYNYLVDCYWDLEEARKRKRAKK